MNTHTDPNREPTEIELLLPWYPSGALDPAEMARVEADLRLHPELNRQLDDLREEREACIAGNKAIPSRSDAALERLMREIEANPQVPRTSHPALAELLGRLDGFLRSLAPERLSWVAVAASFLILVQAGLLGILLWGEPAGEARYRTASGGPDRDGVQLLIQFNPEARLDDINRFLTDNRAEILAGPKPGGFYQVQFHGETKGSGLIERLGGDGSLVKLVLPQP